MDMTNLPFHGLTVSPDASQDDVLDMMARPGQSLRYTVQIPMDHPPGLYWYHTHPHGERHRQVLDGMSGALVIEGIESYFPAVAGLPERVLVVRGRSIVNDPQSTDLKHRVELSSDICGAEPEAPEEVFTLNGSVRPQIEIAPGERQFWRLVNASADRYLDLQVEITVRGSIHETPKLALTRSDFNLRPYGSVQRKDLFWRLWLRTTNIRTEFNAMLQIGRLRIVHNGTATHNQDALRQAG